MDEQNSLEPEQTSPGDGASLEAQVTELNTTARAHLAVGEWESAIECYEQVIAASESEGNTSVKAEALNNIASVHLAMMDWEKALSYASDARSLYQEAGDRIGEAVVLNNLAAAHDGMGGWQEALSIYD